MANSYLEYLNSKPRTKNEKVFITEPQTEIFD